MDVTADDGCRLWAVSSGVGPPLVCCHGGPGLWDYLEPVADLLADLAQVVRWDQRGCGRSSPHGPYTVARFVDDLDAVRAHLGVDRIDLFGHSWGATLVLRYALAYPDRVDRMVYVSGTGIDPDDTWKPAYRAALADRLGDIGVSTIDDERAAAIADWTAEFVDPVTARAHAERLATPWFGINHDCRALVAEMNGYLTDTDVAAACRELTVPTLIVDGGYDPRPRWAVDSLHRALPDAERVNFPHAGHLPWVDDPDGFRAAVAGFLTHAAPPRKL